MKELNNFRKIHFIGIGGAGMSAVAHVLLDRGFCVSGSDLADTPVSRRLAREGATVHVGHRAGHIDGAELVVYSTAIGEENPERRAAGQRGLPVWHRSRVLAEIMRGGRSLAVCGTHGKTTTTSMAALALVEAGLDPTALIGGDVDRFGGNARVGRGDWVVVEADESDASLLEFEPDGIILTNIEAEHLDYYRDLEHVVETFGTFLSRLRPEGKIVACLDSPPVRELLRAGGIDATTYSLDPDGLGGEADWTVRDIEPMCRGAALRFTPVFRGEARDPVRLRVPGLHNVGNALAVLAMGDRLGCDWTAMQKALHDYNGARRRFQIVGRSRGVMVIDDYAHHPTEIRATLAATRTQARRLRHRRIVSVFQPHRYSRTERLAEQFGASFGESDMVILTDVYAAGEAPIDGVSGRDIYRHVAANGHPNVHYLENKEEIAEFLRPRLLEGDAVLTLGAGDVWRVGRVLLKGLRADERESRKRNANRTGAVAGASAATSRT